jgi:hypothetical protein
LARNLCCVGSINANTYILGERGRWLQSGAASTLELFRSRPSRRPRSDLDFAPRPHCISLYISCKQYTRRIVRAAALYLDIGQATAIISSIPDRDGEAVDSKCPAYACSLCRSTCAYPLPTGVVSSSPDSHTSLSSTMAHGHGGLIRHHAAQEVSRSGLPATDFPIQICLANFPGLVRAQ